MILDQRALGLADGLFHRMKLLGDIETRPARLDHGDDAAKMALGALQPLDRIGMGGMDVNVLCHSNMLSPRGVYSQVRAGTSNSHDAQPFTCAGLLVLREDLRDPALRARGAAWKVALSAALEERFAGIAGAPGGIGLLMASQWQGSLLWWGFDPQGRVEDFVAAGLRGFVSAVLATPAKPG